MDNKQEKIRGSLKKDSDTVFENQLERAEGLLSYDDAGRGRPEVEEEKLNRGNSVYLTLAGSWFASEAEDREKPTMDAGEVAQVTGYGKASVRDAVSKLKASGLVKSPKQGKYKVDYSNLSKGLKEIEDKVSSNE
jgi:DNA-binding transcriptional ArsR family regulator